MGQATDAFLQLPPLGSNKTVCQSVQRAYNVRSATVGTTLSSVTLSPPSFFVNQPSQA